MRVDRADDFTTSGTYTVYVDWRLVGWVERHPTRTGRSVVFSPRGLTGVALGHDRRTRKDAVTVVGDAWQARTRRQL